LRKRNPAIPAPGQPEPLLFEDLESPSWPDLFGRVAPLEVDIGFGKGEYLIELSARHPEVNYVGVELSHKRLLKVRDKLVRLDRRNVRLVYGNASGVVPRLFAPGSIRAFTINFPDPWPKRRHHKRRLVTTIFGETLAKTLAPGGTLTLATDDRAYVEQVIEELAKVPTLAPAFRSPGYVTSLPDRVETLYERKFRGEGRTNHYVRYHRVG
jgi:tRNA (guanine-N7-)-methyltransferase